MLARPAAPIASSAHSSVSEGAAEPVCSSSARYAGAHSATTAAQFDSTVFGETPARGRKFMAGNPWDDALDYGGSRRAEDARVQGQSRGAMRHRNSGRLPGPEPAGENSGVHLPDGEYLGSRPDVQTGNS